MHGQVRARHVNYQVRNCLVCDSIIWRAYLAAETWPEKLLFAWFTLQVFIYIQDYFFRISQLCNILSCFLSLIEMTCVNVRRFLSYNARLKITVPAPFARPYIILLSTSVIIFINRGRIRFCARVFPSVHNIIAFVYYPSPAIDITRDKCGNKIITAPFDEA